MWEQIGPIVATALASLLLAGVASNGRGWLARLRKRPASKDDRLVQEDIADRKERRRYLTYAVEHGDELALHAAAALTSGPGRKTIATKPVTMADRALEKLLEDRVEGDSMERMFRLQMQQRMYKQMFDEEDDGGGVAALIKPLLQGVGTAAGAMLASQPAVRSMLPGAQVAEERPPRPALPSPSADVEEEGPNVRHFPNPVDVAQATMRRSAAGVILNQLDHQSPADFAQWLVDQGALQRLEDTIVLTSDEDLPGVLAAWVQENPEFQPVVAWMEQHPEQTQEIIGHVRAISPTAAGAPATEPPAPPAASGGGSAW